MLAAIAQEILAHCAGSSRSGFWTMSSHWYSNQRGSRHAMSLFGLYDVNFTAFSQYAYQFVTHFEGRVGRVWASVKFAPPGFCSRLQRVISPGRGIQLVKGQTRLFRDMGVAALYYYIAHGGQKCWFNFGTLAIQGANACKQLRKPRVGRRSRL